MGKSRVRASRQNSVIHIPEGGQNKPQSANKGRQRKEKIPAKNGCLRVPKGGNGNVGSTEGQAAKKGAAREGKKA